MSPPHNRNYLTFVRRTAEQWFMMNSIKALTWLKKPTIKYVPKGKGWWQPYFLGKDWELRCIHLSPYCLHVYTRLWRRKAGSADIHIPFWETATQHQDSDPNFPSDLHWRGNSYLILCFLLGMRSRVHDHPQNKSIQVSNENPLWPSSYDRLKIQCPQ